MDATTPTTAASGSGSAVGDRLAGRVAIVTGAGMGIGAGVGRHLALQGAAVALTTRTFSKVEAIAEELTAKGARVVPIRCDVGDRGEIESMVAEVAAQLGPPDILVNNAQDGQMIRGPLAEVTYDDAITLFRGGPLASLAAMQACLPYMRERGGGCVVNVASTTGVIGAPNHTAYAMAKEAIRGLTRVAANEWGTYGITVNTICPAALTEGVREFFADNPGVIEHIGEATPLGRMGDPETDVGPVVTSLATDLQYVTGATIMVDGGGRMIA
jgi:NAD(P)-dependent dehydrogenase (short-subunit alcohol dehydrogenase family)